MRPRRLDVLVVLGILGGIAPLACSDTPLPAPTEAVCPDPDPRTLTWESFGQKFMADYCTSCHDSALPRAMRNGAPVYHDYDSLPGVLAIPGHIDERAGSGPAAHNTSMPPARCPSTVGGPLDRDCPRPTDQERTNLAIWLACELERR